MADTDNKDKDIDFKNAKDQLQKNDAVAAKAKKPHTKKNFGWWIGVIILILISITFVLPATGLFGLFATNSIEFGRYNGEPIEYSAGSYMENQYYNLYTQYGAYMDSTSLLYQAYYNAVVHEALDQQAARLGIGLSEEMINRTIIDSGYYNDADGNFDASAYEAAGVSERRSVYNSVETGLPAMLVAQDISSVVSSDAEKDFVASMASSGRSFDYVLFDADLYPADRLVAYANSNPQPFTQITVSIISADSQESADSLMDEVTADPAAFDTHLAEDGLANQVYCFYEVQGLGEENANTLFSTATGSFAGPYQDGSSYDIYRVEAAPSMPDFTTDDMASRIRTYIAANDSEVLTTWSQEAATAFYEDAQANGFDAALENAGTTATNVAVTPANPSAASSMLASFYATDSEGGLRDAANADETYMASLYNSEEGTILAPQASGDYYVVTRVGADGTDEARGTSTHDFYDYMASSIAQSDLQTSILTSSLFEDNFLSVLIDTMGTSN